jgi:hypothetical protein
MRDSVRVTLAAITGGYMLLDGIYARLHGSYIGGIGPWSMVLHAVGIDPRAWTTNGLFIVYGLLWLGAIAFYFTGRRNAVLGMAVLTLWYLPVGTLFSLIIIISYLWRTRQSHG